MYKRLNLEEKLIVANEISVAADKGIIFQDYDLEKVRWTTGQQVVYIGGHDITPEYWNELKKYLLGQDDHCILFEYQMTISYEEASFDCIGCTESEYSADLYAQAITYDEQTDHLIGLKKGWESEWGTWNNKFFLAFHPSTLDFFRCQLECLPSQGDTYSEEDLECKRILETVLQYYV